MTACGGMLTLLMCPSLKLCCLVQVEKKAKAFSEVVVAADFTNNDDDNDDLKKKKYKSLSYLSQLISS